METVDNVAAAKAEVGDVRFAHRMFWRRDRYGKWSSWAISDARQHLRCANLWPAEVDRVVGEWKQQPPRHDDGSAMAIAWKFWAFKLSMITAGGDVFIENTQSGKVRQMSIRAFNARMEKRFPGTGVRIEEDGRAVIPV